MSQALKREQAQSCLDKAKQFIRRGDFVKAEKFLTKSLRQYPLQEATDLFRNLKKLEREHNEKARERARAHDQRQRRQSQQQQQQPPEGDKEQEALKKAKDPEVRRILQEKDYYAIFGLQKGQYDEKVLKKKYRKLAATLHPDRNKDPGAEEAFKKVGRANDCLKDPEKRQIYDTYGTETPEFRQRFRGFHGGSFEEQLFREFAGGRGFHPFFQFHQFGGRRQSRAEPAEPLTGWRAVVQMLTQFLPVILLLSYSFVGSGTSGDNNYFSLSRSNAFSVERETPLGTTFFVHRDFNRYYGRDSRFMQNINDQVEGEYSEKLYNACEKEKLERDELIREASELYGPPRKSKLSAASRKQAKCELWQQYLDAA